MLQQGRPMGDLAAANHGAILAALKRFRRVAGDDVQARVASLLSEESRLLAPTYPDLCLTMFALSRHRGLTGAVERGAQSTALPSAL